MSAAAMAEVDEELEVNWFAVMAEAETARVNDIDGSGELAIGREFIAQFHLRSQGFRTFLPYEMIRYHYKVPSRNEKRSRWVRRPYFPRYLFVRIGGGQSVYAVNETFGIATVVYHGIEPLRVPAAVIEELQERADIKGCIGRRDITQRIPFKSAQRVHFTAESPLAWLIEAVVEVDNGREIDIWVNQLLGERRRVSVKPEHLKPVE